MALILREGSNHTFITTKQLIKFQLLVDTKSWMTYSVKKFVNNWELNQSIKITDW